MTITNDPVACLPPFQNSISKPRKEIEIRVNQFVLGKILPAICLGVSLTSIGLAVTISPFFIIGAISLFPLALSIYNHMHIENRSVFTKANSTPPSETTKPLGLQNNGNNDCWANAAIQLISHCDPLQRRIDTSIWNNWYSDIAKQYSNQAQGKATAPTSFAQQIRTHLLDAHKISSCSSMEDPCILLEELLSRAKGCYCYEQRVDDTLSQPASGSFINLDILPSTDFQQMIHNHFVYEDDLQRKISRKLNTTPQYLLIKINRGAMRNNWLTGEHEFYKKQDDVPITFDVTLHADYLIEGREKKFECCSFLVHHGYSLNSGHYTAYVKKNNSWWLCNDSSVTQISEKTAKEAAKQAYLMCYTPEAAEGLHPSF